jgi:hypothetical protein
MQGENSRALREFEKYAPETDLSGRSWVVQAGQLLTADVYLLTGSAEKAAVIAGRAFRVTDSQPLSDAYAGTVARWLARTATETKNEAGALKFLAESCRSLERFDLVDQAEILSARKWLGQRLGEECRTDEEMLPTVLASLPAAVEDQLRRLGML